MSEKLSEKIKGLIMTQITIPTSVGYGKTWDWFEKHSHLGEFYREAVELEELDKNLCETIEQMRYTIVSLSAGESVKFDLHCSKCGKETKILHPVAIEGEYEFELKQRIAELEEQIKELYADNEALREHYPHFIDKPEANL